MGVLMWVIISNNKLQGGAGHMINIKLGNVRKVAMSNESDGCILGCLMIFIWGIYVLTPVIIIGLILLLIKFLFF